MPRNYVDIERDVNLMLDGLNPAYSYHKKEHTTELVEPAAFFLAHAEKLLYWQVFAVRVAALFHDTGFLDTYLDNEPFAVRRLKDYDAQGRLPLFGNTMNIVSDAILNTNMKQQPKDTYQAILRDADMIAIGRPDYLSINETLRAEALAIPESKLHTVAQDDKSWWEAQLGFLVTHHWFTSSAKRYYKTQRLANIELVRDRVAALKK